MIDCVVLPSGYSAELLKDMLRRLPKASKHVLEHLLALEAFLYNSIVVGLSYGVAKALLLRVSAVLLGSLVGRHASTADPEKTEVIVNFDPLREQTHVQQFLGCTKWVRWLLPEYFPVTANIRAALTSRMQSFHRKDSEDRFVQPRWTRRLRKVTWLSWPLS